MHRFLVAVAFWILAILCLQNIFSSSESLPMKSTKLNSLSLSTASYETPRVASASTSRSSAMSQPAISVWQGPIQPSDIQPASPIPVFSKVPTTEPVIFVGIDDGWVQTPQNLDWLTSHHLPFTLFLTDNGIKNDYGYFKKLQNAGMTIQDHTLSHPHLPKLTLDQQKTEICSTADKYQNVFGERPTLFRPPYGEYNDDTRKAAASCGITAIVLWHVVIGTGGDVQFQTGSNHLQAGDIVLMHFRPEFLVDAHALAEQASQNHLQIGRLEDWLP